MQNEIVQLLAQLYKQHFAALPHHILALRGDGSDRQIFRLFGENFSCIGIHGNNAAENAAFIEFSRHFYAADLTVPQIYVTDLENGIYLEEDLGDTTLFNWLAAQRQQDEFSASAVQMYKKVLSALPHFQIRAGRSIDYSFCYQYPSFAQESMWFDMQYFLDRFATPFCSKAFDRDLVENDLRTLVNYCAQLPTDFFLYRDFQSRNVMIKNNQPYFIDYQSGRRGALQYDVASLLFDAKANIPMEIKQELLEHYKTQAAQLVPLNHAEFDAYFYEFSLLRVLQALGAFGNLGLVKNKPHFLGNIPFGLKNIEILLQQSAIIQKLQHLRALFENDLLVNEKLRDIK